MWHSNLKYATGGDPQSRHETFDPGMLMVATRGLKADSLELKQSETNFADQRTLNPPTPPLPDFDNDSEDDDDNYGDCSNDGDCDDAINDDCDDDDDYDYILKHQPLQMR